MILWWTYGLHQGQLYASKIALTLLNHLNQLTFIEPYANKSMKEEEWVINTSWKHIYHKECLILHVREYLSKCQYPRNCPSRGCKKILGPQEITKDLSPEEYIKFEAFSLQRSGQKSRKQLLWCQQWHIIFALGYDEIICKCRDWGNLPNKFQDVLKHLDINTKLGEQERDEAIKIYDFFIKDCRGIVERCKMCLKRRIKISGYKYEIWICDKVSNTIKHKQSLGLINGNLDNI